MESCCGRSPRKALPEPKLPLRSFTALTVEPRLRAWILRLLSVRPEERGTARELAEVLERAAQPMPSMDTEGTPRRRVYTGLRWLAVAAAGLALAVEWSAPGPVADESASQVEVAVPDQPDAGTVGLGDVAASTSSEDASKLPSVEVMAEDTLPESQPGQARPDAKGRCPLKQLVALNGGCWLESSLESEECAGLGGQMFKGTCYVPFIPPKRRPTSSPTDKP